MSRHNWSHDRYEFVAGVDRATGAFVQVWKKGKDQPILTIDKLGIRETEPMPVQIAPFLAKLKEDFAEFKNQNGQYPNLDEQRAILVARKFGFV